MDISGSEWSSGCESGWTVYLDESSESPYQEYGATSIVDNQQSYKVNEDHEEDMSMVSDASSGPPHFQYGFEEEEEVQFDRGPRFSSSSKKSKIKTKPKEQTPNNQHSFLDDTASSSAFSYPDRSTYPSHNQPSKDHFFRFSHENGFKASSAFGNPFGHRQSSNSRQQHSTEPSWSRGRRRG